MTHPPFTRVCVRGGRASCHVPGGCANFCVRFFFRMTKLLNTSWVVMPSWNAILLQKKTDLLNFDHHFITINRSSKKARITTKESRILFTKRPLHFRGKQFAKKSFIPGTILCSFLCPFSFGFEKCFSFYEEKYEIKVYCGKKFSIQDKKLREKKR